MNEHNIEEINMFLTEKGINLTKSDIQFFWKEFCNQILLDVERPWRYAVNEEKKAMFLEWYLYYQENKDVT